MVALSERNAVREGVSGKATFMKADLFDTDFSKATVITMFLLPAEWPWILAGFAAFRLFDIWKPWPIRWCDRHIDGGFGIMFDDVVAGIFACASLHALRAALAG